MQRADTSASSLLRSANFGNGTHYRAKCALGAPEQASRMAQRNIFQLSRPSQTSTAPVE